MSTRLPVPTDSSTLAVLDRQVELMFLLADEVLSGVTLEECLWRPTEAGWTVHQRDGRWYGELTEEPPNPPTPSLGWTMWHPIWWVTTLLARSRGEEPPAADAVEWPGPDRSLAVVRSLWSDWQQLLSSLSPEQLASGELTRFPYDDGRPFVHVAGWASMELVKNLSEMCLMHRLVRELAG